ncbi:MAG TPA: aldehyde dehydrogenase family protein [Vicinamibacterales bacterium]|jgi:acetaldehyde dehydrogenase (acetylating)|nr:aldehyde dehydrogenase family protein [Vicinamibacterales bacterium]
MAEAAPVQTDRDLTSIHEARTLARRAKQAAPQLAELSQQQIDAIVDAMAQAATPMAEAFARLAVEETGYGVAEDKVQKNLFSSRKVYEFIRPMKTVGVIGRNDARKIVEIAEPFGVVAAVIPSTNPTSTAIYKILIALKARCPIVLSPHPSAVRCISRVAEVMHEAAVRAGAPDAAIGWMKTVTLEGTQELMKHRDVAVILATGGMGLVRAAYSAGKPAYGVGPGNAPAYIERSADIQKAVRDIITGKTFDNGLLCSSENSVVVDEAIAGEVKREFARQGAHFLAPAEIDAVGKSLVSPQRLPNPAMVGRSAAYIAEKSGVSVPKDTTVLIAELAGVGRDYPLSVEKLCPVLSFYVVRDWKEGCERCIQILRYGGMGHTMSIHSKNEDVILQFGLRKPAFRIVVNTPTTHGSVGLTTGLDPAMTLGCGGWGGNITSDNISPRHLLNVKRLAYEVTPASPRKEIAARTGGSAATPMAASASAPAAAAAQRELPRAPAAPRAAGISAASLTARIDTFLATRGIVTATKPSVPVSISDKPADFVCEEDVRQAVSHGHKIVIGDRSIITPAARDLGEQHRIFVQSGMKP